MKKVLIVDDSMLMRQLLTRILDSSPGLRVVGAAADPYEARDMIKRLHPDVITLDVEMPRMDGITFLGNLMRLRPMPVVMVSSLTERGAEITLRALELGAVDYFAKPSVDVSRGLAGYAEEIAGKVISAAHAHVTPLERRPKSAPHQGAGAQQRHAADVIPGKSGNSSRFVAKGGIIGIGASTGGTEAIKEVLSELPPDMPAIVVCQHIPAAFSGPFAARADKQSRMRVAEACDGQPIQAGHVYIAPGDRHLLVRRDGARYVCQLDDGLPVNRHKPSVDVMLQSLAHSAGPNAIGVILTGMGCDGAAGMGEVKKAGGLTLVQDKESSVVWGMPGETVKRGFADEVLGVGRIAPRLVELVQR
ncbi:MAG: chemotaxis response regulator protein-glutamate methylesterase [Gammaproteobacteria bacterium]|nr:chemotaxis response regulator protein-glutamate methylesterase [Gammaproteobacteria bacterium]